MGASSRISRYFSLLPQRIAGPSLRIAPRILSRDGVAPFQKAEFMRDGMHILTAAGAVLQVWDAGLYGQPLVNAAYAKLTGDRKAAIASKRIRFWQVDPAMLQ